MNDLSPSKSKPYRRQRWGRPIRAALQSWMVDATTPEMSSTASAETGSRRHSKAVVLGPTGMALDHRGRVLPHSILHRHGSATETMEKTLRAWCLYRLAGAMDSVSTAVSFTHVWSRNYYHWVTQSLPKLRDVAHANQQGESPTLLIPKDAPPYALASLDAAGRRFRFDVVELSSYAVRCEHLIVGPWPGAVDHPDSAQLRWLRSQILAAVGPPPESRRPRRLYVSRDDATVRAVENERQLGSLLDMFDFEFVSAERLSFTQQVELFRQAEVIAGPHGAGLTNMLWMPPGGTVLEIDARGIRRPCFQRMARGLGHAHRRVGARARGTALQADLGAMRRVLHEFAL